MASSTILALLVVLSVSSLATASSPRDLGVQIALGSPFYAPGKALVVNFELTNPTSEEINLLRWNTPLEGVKSHMFEIEMHDGTTATYTGMVAKRGEPTAAHYARIGVDGLLQGSVDISDAYRFHRNGVYHVRLAFKALDIDGEVHWLLSNSVRLEVVNVHLNPVETMPLAQLAVGYTGCSNSDKNIVEAAIPQATSASLNALNYLNSKDCTSDYITWFGAYNTTRWNKVDTDFTNIHAQFVSLQFNINCECTDPFTYAYVYPTDPTHTIHLCGAFWKASPSPYQYDSQPGTLTHEMSHFNDIAGTDDIVYGTSGCRALAVSDPGDAVDNADSHEYFQESKPSC